MGSVRRSGSTGAALLLVVCLAVVGSVGTVGVSTADAGATERALQGTTWVVPVDRAADLDIGFIDENRDDTADDVDGNVTRTRQAADGEVVMLEFRASGMEGVITNRTEDGANATVAFLREEVDYVRRTGRSNPDPTFDFGVVETNPPANRDPREVRLGTGTIRFLPDYDNDTYYVAVRLANVDRGKFEDDSRWNTTFSVVPQDSLSGRSRSGNRTVAAEWTYYEPDATLRVDGGGLVIRNESNQSIRGTANVAPGTELTVRVEGTVDEEPLLRTLDARVTENRTFVATGDFGGAPATNVTAVVTLDGERIRDAVGGRVVDATAGTATPTATPAPRPTLTEVPTGTPPPTPGATPTPTPVLTPGRTASSTPTTPSTVEATPVTSMAEATPTAAPSGVGTGTTASGGGPGFGAGVGLAAVALAAGALATGLRS